MMDQLTMTQQKNREVKVKKTLFYPNLYTKHTKLTRYTESYSYGWLWTIRILVHILKGYIGKKVWTWGSKHRAGLVKTTVGRLRSTSSLPFLLTDFSNRSTAVACGAVIRALRKEDGPARILQTSYGFLRTEPYRAHEAHASQKPKRDKIDGLDYIDNTIEWMINKVAIPRTFLNINPLSVKVP
jgi:hypothetical protein